MRGIASDMRWPGLSHGNGEFSEDVLRFYAELQGAEDGLRTSSHLYNQLAEVAKDHTFMPAVLSAATGCLNGKVQLSAATYRRMFKEQFRASMLAFLEHHVSNGAIGLAKDIERDAVCRQGVSRWRR